MLQFCQFTIDNANDTCQFQYVHIALLLLYISQAVDGHVMPSTGFRPEPYLQNGYESQPTSVINEIVNINGNLFLRMPFNCTRTHFRQSSIKGIANSREMKVLRESRNLTYSMSMAQDLCPFVFSPLAFITGIIPFAGHKFCMWADHGENYPSVFQAIWLGLSPFTFRWYLCHRRGNALLLHLDHAQMASESLMSLHLIATT